MKKSISKKLKMALIVILLLIIAVISGLLFMAVKNPGVKEEKETLLNYSNKTDLKYRVFLKPNPLYNSDSLEEDKLYITSFVNYIKTNFQYIFNADKPVDIKGDYEILAVVEGYTSEEDKVKVIWQKEFNLSPKTAFESKDSKISIDKEITFSLDEYNSFATQISETAKLNMPVRMSVVMSVNLQASDGKNNIEKKLAPAITIPLDTSYFEIVKSGVEEKAEAVEETKQIQLPVNRNMIIAYGIIAGIAFLALLYVLIFVKGNAPVDIFKKQLNKIFKAHGSRLVAINNEIGTSFGMYYKVKSIEDLVRIADELGKPIMYKYSTDSKEITKFYIHDDKSMYSFNLKDLLVDNETGAKINDNEILNNTREIPLE
ncbi:MAG: hypothetical protein A2Y23_15590 [Clostridiales bacterium GWB2_37_7]|nr:MAG: hypothetical protein A2Y23_15590 [Clostridiales bacterium GWB2_37_7]